MTLRIDVSAEQERMLRSAWGGALDEAALHALAIEGYRSGRLSSAEVGQLLGIPDRWAVNQWLAERNVPLQYSLDDLESDRKALEKLLGRLP